MWQLTRLTYSTIEVTDLQSLTYSNYSSYKASLLETFSKELSNFHQKKKNSPGTDVSTSTSNMHALLHVNMLMKYNIHMIEQKKARNFSLTNANKHFNWYSTFPAFEVRLKSLI